MSRSADAWCGTNLRSRKLVDVERLRIRCPICGARRRCSVREDGALAICYHAGSEQESADGGWVHRLDDATAARVPRVEALPPEMERASDVVLDRAYRALLAQCGLSPAHRDALRARGLLDSHIEQAGYATLDLGGRAALARAVVEAVGEDNAARVPGYALRSDGLRNWASIAGSPGLLVPCRNLAGQIVGLQVRRDNPSPEQGKYAWLSSRAQRGASAASVVHVPVFAPADRAEVVITEGPIKADVSTVLTGRFVVAIPGVSAWQRAVDLCAEIKPRLVWVALDADVAVNRHVALALDKLRAGLESAGIACRALRWPMSEGKGLDDLLSRHRDGFERAIEWTERREAH